MDRRGEQIVHEVSASDHSPGVGAAMAAVALLLGPFAVATAGGEAAQPPPQPATWGSLYSPLDKSSWLANFQAT